ncbi:MAG TPA: NADH:ubiquinone reductase (Na(+)-transporting) subunit C [Bacteroidales bacterium]|nr:NADH:ubiquinone reductase (Na(+)-transporting) subunit C [Bacteroidales bacterium]
MPNFNNRYIFTYAIIMVIIVATTLTMVALKLQPIHKNNVRIEKMQNILKAININSTPKNALKLYDQYIKETLVVNINGDTIKNIDGFNIDLQEEFKKTPNTRNLPIYIGIINSEKYFIIPVVGKGLWGPIWGYIGFYDDLNTIYGAFFDHQGETPGLGAEISTDIFQQHFKGKKIFNDEGKFVSVKLIKGGANPDNLHEVDAITGGTITSNGVTDMLYNTLNQYINFIKKYHTKVNLYVEK